VMEHAHSLGSIRARSSYIPKGPRVKVAQDAGCAVGGPSCLACTLPSCVWDLTSRARARLFAKYGLPYVEDTST
jgi:hypothetical protein